ncbi:unnamed protein product, partial [Didymodactylos carnosus]
VGLVDDAAFVKNSNFMYIADDNANYEANGITAISTQSKNASTTARSTPKNDSLLIPRSDSSLLSSQQKQSTTRPKSMEENMNNDHNRSPSKKIYTSTSVHKPTVYTSPQLMDVLQHRALERGQRLLNVHIAHPASPSTIHIMLDEDYATALNLLTVMHHNGELSAEKSTTHFKPQVNHLCAVFHEGRWFRCRCIQVLEDTVEVQYIDWGMIVSATKQSIRPLPNIFYNDPACCIQCRLDGVLDMKLDDETIKKCMALLSKDNYEVLVTNYDSIYGGTIVLYCENENINDQIYSLLNPSKMSISSQQEFDEQFHYQLALKVGEEHKAILSSFSGKDDSFYVLLANDITVAVDNEMTQLSLDTSRSKPITPHVRTLISAKYENKWHRAWVKSIDATLHLMDLTSCPESVRTLPWLGIRVRFHNEKLSHEELSKFWSTTESNYITIRVEEIRNNYYTVSVKVDYSTLLRLERSKINAPLIEPIAVAETSNTRDIVVKILTEASVQTTEDERGMSTIPAIQQQPLQTEDMSNNVLINNLIQSFMNEINLLHIRIEKSEEKRQDRDLQLMTQLITTLKHKN